MSNLFLEKPEQLKEVLSTEEKNGNLIPFLNHILGLKIENLEIKPEIEKIESYKGTSSEKNFFIIQANATLKKTNEIVSIGMLTIPEDRIFQNIFVYWTYYYEKYIYPKNPIMQEVIMNQIGIEKEMIEDTHQILYFGVEEKNPNKLQDELEFHIIDIIKYLEIHQEEFPSFYSYLSNFKGQKLIIVPHF